MTKKDAWSEKALSVLRVMLQKLHESHKMKREAWSEPGLCYICGREASELIREGERLFPKKQVQ